MLLVSRTDGEARRVELRDELRQMMPLEPLNVDVERLTVLLERARQIDLEPAAIKAVAKHLDTAER